MFGTFPGVSVPLSAHRRRSVPLVGSLDDTRGGNRPSFHDLKRSGRPDLNRRPPVPQTDRLSGISARVGGEAAVRSSSLMAKIRARGLISRPHWRKGIRCRAGISEVRIAQRKEGSWAAFRRTSSVPRAMQRCQPLLFSFMRSAGATVVLGVVAPTAGSLRARGTAITASPS